MKSPQTRPKFAVFLLLAVAAGAALPRGMAYGEVRCLSTIRGWISQFGSFVPELAPSAPGIPTVTAQTIYASGKKVGVRYRVSIVPDRVSGRLGFVWGGMVEAIRARNGFAKKFGFSIEKNGVLTYVDAAGLNHYILALRKAGDPLAPHLTFWVYDGPGEAPVIEYAEHWVKGEAVISSDGRFHFHDTNVHALGYLLLPKEILEVTQARLRTVLALIKDPRLVARRAYFEGLLKEEVDRLDRPTAGLASALQHGDRAAFCYALDNELLKLARGTRAMIEARESTMERFSPAEHAAIEEIVAQTEHAGVPFAELPGIIDRIASQLKW